MATAVPSVKTIGDGPPSRNCVNAGGDPVLPSWSNHGKPVTTVCAGQSRCLSTSHFENVARCSEGECQSVSGFTPQTGCRPICRLNRCQGLANTRDPHLRI